MQYKGTFQTKKAEQVTYAKSGDLGIKIEFPFNQQTVMDIKTLPGRKYHIEGSKKYWTCPLSMEAIEKLNGWGFQLDERLQAYLARMTTPISSIPRITNIPGLRRKPFPFQYEGISFVEHRNGNALIGDEMGLGKTIQALGYLQLHPEKRPAIIVCPASLKLNWANEATQWMHAPKVQVLSGTNTNVPLIGEILIINYDIIAYWLEELLAIKPQVLITDECHYYKNSSAKRTKAVLKLGKNIPHKIALSGTPIVNRPIEIYNAIRMVDKTIIPNFWQFAQRYCGAKHNGFGWNFNGASNTQELHEKLSNTIMIRRLKKDVLTELPDKIRSFIFIPLELNNQREYSRAEDDFIAFVREQKGVEAANKASNAQALAEIEGLKQLAVQGKMEQVIDWIQNFIKTDEKLVIMATHRFVIDTLMTKFKHVSVKVDGSVSNAERQNAVKEFQHNPRVRLFIGNIKAAGVGLTLTASSTVAFLELPWTPGDVSQAEDRVHRIGQRNSVNIYYLLAAGTIEEKIARLIDDKRRVLDTVLDGRKSDESSLLGELMREYE